MHLFGTSFEAALQEAGDGAKNKNQAKQRRARVVAKWLEQEQKFRDPVGSSSSQAKNTGETVSSEMSGIVKL